MFVLKGGSPGFVPIIVWAPSCRRASSIFSRHEEEFKKKIRCNNTPAINFLLKSRNFPGDTLVTNSTSQITATTRFKSLRARARQIAVRFASDDDLSATDATGYKWRLGTTRVEIQPSGRR